jgi:hypothetical protein
MSRDKQRENRRVFNASHRDFTYPGNPTKRVDDPTPMATYLSKGRKNMVTGTHTKYETSDIALAAYLFASSTPMTEVNRTNPRRVLFTFQPPRQELLDKWQSGNAMINALAFHNAYQELKQRLFRD